MHADRTGLKATVLYWAGGSIEKVFELLLAVMAAFGLRQRMADELKVQAEGTSASIVSRLRGALAILQGCKNEEQRQHYRVSQLGHHLSTCSLRLLAPPANTPRV